MTDRYHYPTWKIKDKIRITKAEQANNIQYKYFIKNHNDVEFNEIICWEERQVSLVKEIERRNSANKASTVTSPTRKSSEL